MNNHQNILNDIYEEKPDPKVLEEIRCRRGNFTIKPFDLGQDVPIDRDQIYSERGIQVSAQ